MNASNNSEQFDLGNISISTEQARMLITRESFFDAVRTLAEQEAVRLQLGDNYRYRFVFPDHLVVKSTDSNTVQSHDRLTAATGLGVASAIIPKTLNSGIGANMTRRTTLQKFLLLVSGMGIATVLSDKSAAAQVTCPPSTSGMCYPQCYCTSYYGSCYSGSCSIGGQNYAWRRSLYYDVYRRDGSGNCIYCGTAASGTDYLCC